MATFAPCSAKRTAIAWPMPDEPPVMRTFLPWTPANAWRRSSGSATGMVCDMRGLLGSGVTDGRVVAPGPRPLQALGEPGRLAGALGAVGLAAAPLLGDPGGHEAEQRRPVAREGLDRRVPARQSLRELVGAARAPARVAVAQLALPRLDAAQQPAARGHHLGPLGHDLAVELDRVEHAAGPVRQVLDAAGVDAAPARVDLGVHPGPGLRAGEGPVKRGEDARAVGAQELVGDHEPSQSRKARSRFSRVSPGISSSAVSRRPTAAIVARISSR